MFNRTSSIRKAESWLFQYQPLTFRQKVAISVAFVSCLFSTAVCAPMGGSGSQSVFQTKSPIAYWPFFFLSPLLILCLCGRATYYLAKELTKPHDPKWEIIRKPLGPKHIRMAKAIGWGVLGMWSSAINAYNTTEYVPGYLGWICFPFALCVPGIVNVPAIKEYHRRIFIGAKWLLLKLKCLSPTPKSACEKLQESMSESKRFYEHQSYEDREKTNAIFSHPFEKNKVHLLISLSNSSGNMIEPVTQKHPITYFFATLGLLVGTLSQAFSYSLGEEIGNAVSLGKFQFIFGIGCAYLGIGMAGVACSDVFSEMSDTFHHWYTTKTRTTKPQHNTMRLILLFLALAASSCFVENQIRVMGQEGLGGKLLTTCAIISPTCIGFWAGSRVLEDGLSSSYRYFHGRLEKALPRMKNQDIVDNQEEGNTICFRASRD